MEQSLLPTSLARPHREFLPVSSLNSSARFAAETPTRTFTRISSLVAKSAARSRTTMTITTITTIDDHLAKPQPAFGQAVATPGCSADLPKVTVLVPVRNEEQYIVDCIESLLAQDYPQELFEIIVLDGASTDGTERLVRQFETHTGRVRYVDNPNIMVASALNVGLREAAGEIIVRMDAHGRAPAHYLSTVVRHLLEKGADHVGVKQHAIGKGFWGECIARGISSPFGVGGSKHRCSTKDGWDEAGWLGGFWKAKVLALGGFDE